MCIPGPTGTRASRSTFPDALTTWRTTIRAMTDDGKAGGVVTRVLVRKNLIVRLAAPRFFRQGDETVLRVIAHNYLETAKDVTFALDVTGRGGDWRADAEGEHSRQGRELCGLAGEGARDRQRGADGQGADQRRVRRAGDDAAGAALRREAARGGLGRGLLRHGAEPVEL